MIHSNKTPNLFNAHICFSQVLPKPREVTFGKLWIGLTFIVFFPLLAASIQIVADFLSWNITLKTLNKLKEYVIVSCLTFLVLIMLCQDHIGMLQFTYGIVVIKMNWPIHVTGSHEWSWWMSWPHICHKPPTLSQLQPRIMGSTFLGVYFFLRYFYSHFSLCYYRLSRSLLFLLPLMGLMQTHFSDY